MHISVVYDTSETDLFRLLELRRVATLKPENPTANRQNLKPHWGGLYKSTLICHIVVVFNLPGSCT